MKTLLVGCSYVENIFVKNPLPGQFQINPDRYHIRGTSGAGNQSIAARVIYESQYHDFDKICVLWSGINRLDFPIGKSLHDTFRKDKDGYPEYAFHTPMGEMMWYHSGGFGLSGQNNPCPRVFQDFFNNQYKSSTPAYLTQMTALSVIQTQTFAKAKGIDCRMAFIYDIDVDYNITRDDQRFVEPGCGRIDRNAELVSLIDWNMFVKSKPPFESGRDANRLYDGFHPDFDFMIDWLDTAFELDLRS